MITPFELANGITAELNKTKQELADLEKEVKLLRELLSEEIRNYIPIMVEALQTSIVKFLEDELKGKQ